MPMLITVMAWCYCRTTGRVLLTGYMLFLAFALSYGGQHYLVGIVIGVSAADSPMSGHRRRDDALQFLHDAAQELAHQNSGEASQTGVR